MNQKPNYTSQEIFDSIKKKIIKLEYLPGEPISENQICGEYGVSRSVIRIVFTKLSQLKLIDIVPQKNTYVAKIDLELIENILTIRTALEKEIIEIIFHELTIKERENLISKLTENIKKQKTYLETATYSSEFRKLDTEFHQILVDGAKKDNVFDLLNSYYSHLSRWRNFDVSFYHRVPELYKQHEYIVECIKNNDELATKTAISKHLMTVKTISGKLKETYPDYFI